MSPATRKAAAAEPSLVLRDVALTDLAPSATNPRKSFDEEQLGELASSIASQGVLQPLVVRPVAVAKRKKGTPAYEIVAGERRFRASGLAGLDSVPCIIRDLTDDEVLEVQTIENLQRADLHPLEEAEGFAELMKREGYDVARIADRVSRSTKYVYDRMKLLQLHGSLRKVFLAGEITVAHAVLLARLTPTDQVKVLGDRHGYGGGLFEPVGDLSSSTLDLGLADPHRKARSVRELDAWINRNVRFRPEDVDLPNLFPETEFALAQAEEEKLKVVQITREYRVPDLAKAEGERTYGKDHWRRADGQDDGIVTYHREKRVTAPCESAVLGVVVAGPGRGEAFPVCVSKKKCDVHWLEERKAAERDKAKGSNGSRESASERERRWEEERAARQREQERWEKAKPAMLEAISEKLGAAPVDQVAKVVIDRCSVRYQLGREAPTQMLPGETADEVLRYCAFLTLHDLVDNHYGTEIAAKKAGEFGVPVAEILDREAPVDPPAEASEPAAPAKKKAPKKPPRKPRKKPAAGAGS